MYYLAEVYNYAAGEFQAIYDRTDGTTLVFDTPGAARRYLALNRGIISNLQYQIVVMPEGFMTLYPCRVIY